MIKCPNNVSNANWQYVHTHTHTYTQPLRIYRAFTWTEVSRVQQSSFKTVRIFPYTHRVLIQKHNSARKNNQANQPYSASTYLGAVPLNWPQRRWRNQYDAYGRTHWFRELGSRQRGLQRYDHRTRHASLC